MREHTTENLTEGDTVAVTIRMDGHDDTDGELTITKVEGPRYARVENGAGDAFELNFWGDSRAGEIASLQKHGETLARIVDMEGY